MLKRAKSEQSRRSLASFVSLQDSKYRFLWFHKAIAERLQQIERGEIKKLMVFMPPQHGKSQLTTRFFPAWILGRSPNLKIAVASYSATVARRFSRDVKRLIDSENYKGVFPEITLPTAKDSYTNSVDLIEIVGKKGSAYFVGRGGSLTGMSVDIGIIDDPLKDRSEAMSPVILESLWSWYTDVFASRILDTGRQVLIQTRWAQDDLAGRLLEQDGYFGTANPNGWVVVSFPALRTEEPNPNDPRQVGEALWPERKSAETLLRIKKNNGVTFNSLYQQDPKPDEEVLIFTSWQPIDAFPDNVETVIYGLDFGFTNDPTAVVKVGIDGENMFVQEVLYETGLTNAAIAARIKAANIDNNIFVCDSSEPKSIYELQGLGVNAMPAVKGAGSKRLGIDRMKQYNVFYVKSGVNLQREIKNYKWIVVAGSPTNTPQDGNDHLMDAIRYVIQTIII